MGLANRLMWEVRDDLDFWLEEWNAWNPSVIEP